MRYLISILCLFACALTAQANYPVRQIVQVQRIVQPYVPVVQVQAYQSFAVAQPVCHVQQVQFVQQPVFVQQHYVQPVFAVQQVHFQRQVFAVQNHHHQRSLFGGGGGFFNLRIGR